MCKDKSISGMKLVFIKYVKELNDKGDVATPAKIAKEYNMTYRQILNIAFFLDEKGYIKRNCKNWTMKYEVTNEGRQILLA